jgi:hypothetical protein
MESLLLAAQQQQLRQLRRLKQLKRQAELSAAMEAAWEEKQAGPSCCVQCLGAARANHIIAA